MQRDGRDVPGVGAVSVAVGAGSSVLSAGAAFFSFLPKRLFSLAFKLLKVLGASHFGISFQPSTENNLASNMRQVNVDLKFRNAENPETTVIRLMHRNRFQTEKSMHLRTPGIMRFVW